MDDNHVIIDGARWHWPMQKQPTRCGVRGCTRKLGQA